MADQQNTGADQYGPFSSALLGPLSGQKQAASVSYAPSGAGAVALYASKFLEGLQAGRRTQFERSEQTKAEHRANFQDQYGEIMGSDQYTPEAKRAAQDVHDQAMGVQIQEAVKGAGPEHKDNPIMNLAKHIGDAMAGPSSNQKHKDYGDALNSLISIKRDPNSRQDPSQIGTIDSLEKIRQQQGGAAAPAAATQAQGAAAQPVAQAAAPAQTAPRSYATAPEQGPKVNGLTWNPQTSSYTTAPPPSQPQAAGASQTAAAAPAPTPQAAPIAAANAPVAPATTPPPGTQPSAVGGAWKYRTQQEAEADPAFIAAWQDANRRHVNFDTTQLGKLYAATPRLGVPLPEKGVTVAVFGPDGKPAFSNALRTSQGDLVNPTTRQTIPGAVEVTAALGSETKAVNPIPPTMQKVWVQQPGTDAPEYAFVNPKNPNGYLDVKGQPLPEGTNPVAAPTEGSGQARSFLLMATSQLAQEGIPKPTPAQLKIRAGDLAVEYYGSSVARRQQEMYMDQALSGIGAGPGLGGGKRTALPPGNQPKPAAGAIASATAAPTPTPGSATTSPSRPTTQPPNTVKPGSGTSSASGLSQSQADDAQYFMATTLGTQKGGGKGGAIKSQRGMQILQQRTGLNPMELQAAIADDQATKKALSDAVQVSGAFGRVQETLKEHGQVLEDAAKAYGPGNTPIATRTWQWVQQNAGAHPELTKYIIAVNAVQREYGRLISGGAQSRAMLPVAAIQQGETVIRPDATMKDITAAVDQLRLEADTEQKAFGNQQATLKTKLATGPIGRAFSSTTKPVTLTITGPDGKESVHQYDTQAEADEIKRTAPKGFTVK